MKPKIRVKSNRIIRHYRIRKNVSGSNERLRLSVYPSLKHFEAQLVDDFDRKTVFGSSTKDKDFQNQVKLKSFGNVKAAEEFGKFFATTAKQKGYAKVVLDRGGFLYHGRIKAFAEAARKQGLLF